MTISVNRTIDGLAIDGIDAADGALEAAAVANPTVENHLAVGKPVRHLRARPRITAFKIVGGQEATVGELEAPGALKFGSLAVAWILEQYAKAYLHRCH